MYLGIMIKYFSELKKEDFLYCVWSRLRKSSFDIMRVIETTMDGDSLYIRTIVVDSTAEEIRGQRETWRVKNESIEQTFYWPTKCSVIYTDKSLTDRFKKQITAKKIAAINSIDRRI